MKFRTRFKLTPEIRQALDDASNKHAYKTYMGVLSDSLIEAGFMTENDRTRQWTLTKPHRRKRNRLRPDYLEVHLPAIVERRLKAEAMRQSKLFGERVPVGRLLMAALAKHLRLWPEQKS